MAADFSQQFCSVAPCGPGGRIIAGRRLANCLVAVGDGELVLIQAPSTLVARAPAPGVQIVTPPVLRRIGTAVILLVDSSLLAVEFDMVYRRQRDHASPAGGVRKALRSLFGIGAPVRSMRLGRALAREFAGALTAAGAADRDG